MGLFGKLFGKGKTKCGSCGRSFDLPSQLMTIHALNINDFSISGMGGYCIACGHYLCDRHVAFLKAYSDPADIEYFVGCPRHQIEVTLEPREIDPDIERISFINIK